MTMFRLSQIETIKAFFRQPWVIALALGICLAPWLVSRIELLYFYQTPPSQTIHPNYFTFHEMSQRWMEGQQLGTLDLNRMYVNMRRSALSDYITDRTDANESCLYLSLDPGLAVIITAARDLFPKLPDSYLRLVTLQLIADGIMLTLLFATFLRWGLLPAVGIGAAYAVNSVFAYNAIYPFQYFWEGWLVGITLLSLIWARRGILAQKRVWPVLLMMLAGGALAFTLWVRASALIVAIAVILALMFVPSLRRYSGAFLIIFALCMAPQIVRASSAAGGFALSTRMSWHTAYQALGRYPNAYGLEDDDLYVFTKSQNENGIKYNYCDYRQHDLAMKQDYLDLWQKDPGYIVQSITARVVSGLLYNSDQTATNVQFLIAFLLACFTMLLAIRRGGEALFVTGVMGLVYGGYCLAVGMVYSMGAPYAYVSQLALVYFVPVLLYLCITGFDKTKPQIPSGVLRNLAFYGLLSVLALGAAVLQVPAVKNYVFPKQAYQSNWVVYGAPNRADNERLTQEWKNLDKNLQEKFLKDVHKVIPKTAVPEDDVSRYLANYMTVIGYIDNTENGPEPQYLYTLRGNAVDTQLALAAVFNSIKGMRIDKASIIRLNDPASWDGNRVDIRLLHMLERQTVPYKQLTTEKFNRFGFDVEWLTPNVLRATYRGWGCDALRHVLGIFYGGACPYDPRTGPNPYDEKVLDKKSGQKT